MAAPRSKISRIHAHLRLEIARRGVAASPAFAALALLSFFYPFGRTEAAFPMRLAAAAAFAASLGRFLISKRASQRGLVQPAEYQRLTFFILANALAWALFFCFSHEEAIRKQEWFTASFMMLIGFCSASLVSLSASRFFCQFFVLTNLGAQLILLGYFALFTRLPVDNSTFIMVIAFIAYLLWEARKLRRQMIKRYRVQLRLELANRRLRRSREELVEQTARTVHASRLASLGEMAGGIAHEINNPLAIIDLSLESFRIFHAKLHGPLDPSLTTILERARKATQRISGIVKGLKNFSRAGDHDPLVEVSVGQILDDTLGLCAEKFRAHEVTLTVEGPRETKLRCRPIEVAQILINLLNNAFDAVAELPFEERQISITVEDAGRLLRLRVTNAGPVIPPLVAEKLFQPFFTTKEPGKGTGLGLSVSHTIAQSHGGQLFLEAGAKVTTFVLELPRC